MAEHPPLPPEPVSSAAGKTIGLLFAALLLLLGVVSLFVIWGYGDIENLLRIVASFLVVALLIAATALIVRRK